VISASGGEYEENYLEIKTNPILAPKQNRKPFILRPKPERFTMFFFVRSSRTETKYNRNGSQQQQQQQQQQRGSWSS